MTSNDIRESSKEALKMVYYIIIGLAIIEALSRTFLIDGSFIGWQIFNKDNIRTTLLLFALVPTVCRFIHGASIHLDTSVKKRFKPIIDFAGFLLQASFFYIMAISLRNPRAFLLAYVIMLCVDSIWLLFIGIIKYHRFQKTDVQWLTSDVIIIVTFVIFHLLYRRNPVEWIIWVVMFVSIIATVLDYVQNRSFYFPISKERG